MKDHIKLTMTGPATSQGEDSSSEEMRDSFVTVLVARHSEAMWVHMKQGLEALPGPHHHLVDQVTLCCLSYAISNLVAAVLLTDSPPVNMVSTGRVYATDCIC